jgi:hypothetical protein
VTNFDDDLDDDLVAGEAEDIEDHPPGVHFCNQCDAKYTGGNTGHCMVPGCHKTFMGITAFDDHHKNKGTAKIVCMTSEEMEAGGMWAEVNAHGTEVWHGHWNKAGKQLRRPKETIKKG